MTVGHLIVFKGSKRIDKPVPYEKLGHAADIVRKLRAEGVKAHLVYRTDKGTFPPPSQVRDMRDLGMLWCPYCRAWRWFSVPKYRPNTEVNSYEWYMNSFYRQGLKVCQWCGISEMEWWVRKVNDTWGEANHRRRRRKKRAR